MSRRGPPEALYPYVLEVPRLADRSVSDSRLSGLFSFGILEPNALTMNEAFRKVVSSLYILFVSSLLAPCDSEN